MKTWVKTLLSGACLAGLFAATTANALTINDQGVVGTVDGLSGDTGPQEVTFAQHILDLPAGTVNNIFGTPAHTYNTSSTEYSGTLEGSGIQGQGGSFSVPAGWEYALAKYDGQNAGYVLFFLNGAATDLPEYSYSIWGKNDHQYQISHYTVFNSSDFTPTPDGGATIALLGFALLGVDFLRRKLSRA